MPLLPCAAKNLVHPSPCEAGDRYQVGDADTAAMKLLDCAVARGEHLGSVCLDLGQEFQQGVEALAGILNRHCEASSGVHSGESYCRMYSALDAVMYSALYITRD